MIVSKQSYFSHLFIDIGCSFVIENIERYIILVYLLQIHVIEPEEEKCIY